MKRITLTILSVAMAVGIASAEPVKTEPAKAAPAKTWWGGTVPAKTEPAKTIEAKPQVASTATPRVNARRVRQNARINQGVRSGELTRHETHSLRRDQRHIARMEHHAKADGQVTPAERARLNKAQNHESRKIYRLKHNERERRSS